MRLRIVYFYLENEVWMREAHVLAGELEAAGIVCRWIDRTGGRPASGWNGNMSNVPEAVLITDSRETWRNTGWDSETILNTDTGCSSETIFITDSREAAREAARRGTVCIACADDSGFFEGAQLVVEGLAELEPEVLEEFLLRTQGFPVTITRTERLVIREIAKEDFARLRGISMQAGMEHALRGGGQEGPPQMFSDEYLSMYIKYVYKFYGYGLWSVFLHDGTLIGCCGFCNLDLDVPHSLELQYMLAREAQGHGYAQEMCRAALRFAFARTDADEVWVCVHRDNAPSVRLAERLGFLRVNGSGTEELLHYRLSISKCARQKADGKRLTVN